MKKTIVLIFAMTLFLCLGSYAQRGGNHGDFEKYKSQKIAFITEKINLSPTEAQNFWPVYNQMEKDRMTIQSQRRELEQKTRDENIKMTDQEIIKITRDIASTFRKEADISASYNEKFLKILSPQKVLQLYRAENQFRAHLFDQYRKQRKEGE